MEIRKALPAHFTSIMSIADKQLGHSYIDLDLYYNTESIVLVAILEGQVVGFCTGFRVSLPDLHLRIPSLSVLKTKQHKGRGFIGYVESIATDPSRQGKGIASALLDKCVYWLENKQVSAVFMTGWKSSSGVHIKGLARRSGFEEVAQINNFWHKQSLVKKYQCPECGAPPCLCSAVVFVRQ